MTAATVAGIVLPGVPESVREARALVRRQLGAGDAAEAAALVVSELATNAICYTRSGLPGGTFAVSVQQVPGGVVIRVRDAGSRVAPVLAVFESKYETKLSTVGRFGSA